MEREVTMCWQLGALTAYRKQLMDDFVELRQRFSYIDHVLMCCCMSCPPCLANQAHVLISSSRLPSDLRFNCDTILPQYGFACVEKCMHVTGSPSCEDSHAQMDVYQSNTKNLEQCEDAELLWHTVALMSLILEEAGKCSSLFLSPGLEILHG